MKLATHYRDSLDSPLCEKCAEHSILKVEVQLSIEAPQEPYEPLECLGCFDLILLEDEAEAKARA